jgi:hypothetical protein
MSADWAVVRVQSGLPPPYGGGLGCGSTRSGGASGPPPPTPPPQKGEGSEASCLALDEATFSVSFPRRRESPLAVESGGHDPTAGRRPALNVHSRTWSGTFHLSRPRAPPTEVPAFAGMTRVGVDGSRLPLPLPGRETVQLQGLVGGAALAPSSPVRSTGEGDRREAVEGAATRPMFVAPPSTSFAGPPPPRLRGRGGPDCRLPVRRPTRPPLPHALPSRP